MSLRVPSRMMLFCLLLATIGDMCGDPDPASNSLQLRSRCDVALVATEGRTRLRVASTAHH